MKKAFVLTLGLMLVSIIPGFADEDAVIQAREWIINGQSINQINFTATFDKYENGSVYLQMPDGFIRQIMPAQMEGKGLAYIQRMISKIPSNLSRPQAAENQKLLVDISANDLQLGTLTEWKNNGVLGGAFHAINKPLTVEEVAGRKAVRFYYGPWAIPLDFQAMVADFYAPDALAPNKPFTVIAWLYNPSPLGIDGTRETVLSWHTILGDDGTDIGYGQEGRYPHEKGTNAGAYCGPLGGFGFPDKTFPSLNQWHQIAYVCDGTRDGKLRLYVDGRLASERTFDRILSIKPATGIKQTEADVNAYLFLRNGKPVKVTVCIGEKDNHYWRSTLRWKYVQDLGTQGSGPVSYHVTGLKPGTKYFYRFVAVADNETRWSDGAGSFVTADDKGTEGKALPRETDRLMFLGCNWGSTWDWATKPQMVYTGAIADLKVFKGALSEAEVKGLYDGPAIPADESIVDADKKASAPTPADKATGTSVQALKFTWTPSKLAPTQKLYFGTDRTAVLDGTCKWSSRILGKDEKEWSTMDLPPAFKFEYGKTYYWRVEQIGDGTKPIAKGDIWQFTVENYFDPEFDGIVSEPYPSDVRQNGYYGKLMEASGTPVIAAADCPDLPMRICGHTTSKMLQKRPEIQDVLEAMNCATHLDYGDRGWGGTEFTCASYGNVRTFTNDPTFYWGINILMHEMGHQYHIWGAEQYDPEFRQKLYDLFWANKKDGKWVGDYGGLNIWEYMAVSSSAFVSDGSEDETICRREQFRQNDPRMFYFLEDIWPGDTLIELNPMIGMHTDANGNITSWANNAGLEYYGKFGVDKHDWSTGSFGPIGQPKLTTVAGVSAVQLSGKDGLAWNKNTRECLVENHAWSVELWAYADKPENGQTLVAWGPDSTGIRIQWGAIGHGGKTDKWSKSPASDKWHHIVCLFKGGGLDNTEGTYKVYIDGTLDSTGKFKVDVPSGAPVLIGIKFSDLSGSVENGFTGALANVRIYDYALGDTQLLKHYAEENGFYKRANLNVAGSLLVDLDAKQLAPSPVGEIRPTYRPATGRDWVRSWYNRGTMGGKMQNDKKMPENSDPKIKTVAGVTALTFDGSVRMVSSFTPSLQMLISGACTIEMWVYRNSDDKGGTVFQWGNHGISSRNIPAGKWHYVTSTLTAPPTDGRLHFGATWDGTKWINYFSGAIAQLRIHSGMLSAAQIAANSAIELPVVKPTAAMPKAYPIIDLDASKLADGKLDMWKNTGTAGGKFTPADFGDMEAPSVVEVDGKKGVSFFGNKYLASSFDAPKGITGNGDFSLSVWVYDPVVQDGATMVSWGSGDKVVQFNYAKTGDEGAFRCGDSKTGFGGPVEKVEGPYYNAPFPTYWNHIVYTYADGRLKIYVNGILNTDKAMPVNIADTGKIVLGALGNDLRFRGWPFSGIFNDVKIYDHAVSLTEVKDLYNGKGATPLVWLNADSLKTGKLLSWKNQGTAGGELAVTPRVANAPKVETVAGRRAVTFEGGMTFLKSDINTPQSVTGIKPVTVEMWVYNPEVSGEETVFSLAPREAFKTDYLEGSILRSLELRYATCGSEREPGAVYTGYDVRSLGWKDGKAPEAKKWHRITFVYDGNHQGEAKLYVDGKFETRKGYYTICTNGGLPMFIGTAWNTETGPIGMYSGSIASLKVYDYAKTESEITSTSE